MKNKPKPMEESRLKDCVRISKRFARSTNVERDREKPSVLEGYVPTTRALEVLDSILREATDGEAGGAWSITGPYGTGKSSLAVFLDALFGKSGETRTKALELLDSDLAQRIESSHARYGTNEKGFFLGVVTASREPIGTTILDALTDAVQRHFGKMPTQKECPAVKQLKELIRRNEKTKDDPRVKGPQTTELVYLAKKLADTSPVLLIVDEFGKNLEAATESSDGDPYLLQQLAEAGSGSGSPIFLLTLQHLSFEDYFADSGENTRKEWAKVQGRFEDVSFIESPHQTRQLLKTVFTHDNENLRTKIAEWAEKEAVKAAKCGLSEVADAELIKSCYPLGSLPLAILPELCSRYGQNERTIFSFIAKGVGSFLEEESWNYDEPLPTIDLQDIYNFFVAGGVLSQGLSASSNRWTEISLTLRDTHDLTTQQETLAKSIAILNLVSTTGSVRASAQVLQLQCGNQISDLISQLQDKGLITYREYSDEYRIWRGSDIDLSSLIQKAKDKLKRKALIDILRECKTLAPVVAARHSSQTGTLRIFERKYVGKGENLEPISTESVFDGLCLYVLGNQPVSVGIKNTHKPIVIVNPLQLEDLDQVGRDFASLRSCLESEEAQSDWVIRKELEERLAEVESRFTQVFDTTFSAENCSWQLIREDGLEKLPTGRGSSPLSTAADIAYDQTPSVNYEVINRHKLSGNGARAQRLLVAAMIEHGNQDQLGFQGYKPEVAAYKGFLEINKLHRKPAKHLEFGLMKPTPKAGPEINFAWNELMKKFKEAKQSRIGLDEIYRVLASPPIGMKRGVIPIFVIAGLLAKKDEIALFEIGTFKPRFDVETSELLLKNPETFSIKHFGNTKGGRKQAIDALQREFGIDNEGLTKARVSNVLTVITHIMKELSKLKPFTFNTADLTPNTLAVRQSLVDATDPDLLLFEDLPTALGLKKLAHDTEYQDFERFVTQITDSIRELQECYGKLLIQLQKIVAASYGGGFEYDAIAKLLSSVSTEIGKSNLLTILGIFKDSKDENESIEKIATVVVGKAIQEWTDTDIGLFKKEFEEIGPSLRRIEELHRWQKKSESDSPSASVVITHSDGRTETFFIDLDDTKIVNSSHEDNAPEELLKPIIRRVLAESPLEGSLIEAEKLTSIKNGKGENKTG